MLYESPPGFHDESAPAAIQLRAHRCCRWKGYETDCLANLKKPDSPTHACVRAYVRACVHPCMRACADVSNTRCKLAEHSTDEPVVLLQQPTHLLQAALYRCMLRGILPSVMVKLQITCLVLRRRQREWIERLDACRMDLLF